MDFVDKASRLELGEEDADGMNDIEFHSNVRENIIFVLLFLMLLSGSYTLIERFRRRDQQDIFSTEDDEIKVYRISIFFCIFSFAISIGSLLLLPISIISNEVLLLYPKSFYIQWLNSSLIQGLWNNVFVFANLAIFVLLPFAYLFSESSGFIGHRKGVFPRFYETSIVFTLLIIAVIGLVYVVLAVFYPERSSFVSMFNITTYHLPFLYSCVSFIGVLLLLVCTPIGFIRLFGLVNRMLVRPSLLRDVVEDFETFQMEEASVIRKIDSTKIKVTSNGTYKLVETTLRNRNEKNSSLTPSRLCGDLQDLYSVKPISMLNDHEKSLLELQIQAGVPNKRNIAEALMLANGSSNGRKSSIETTRLIDQLRELERDKVELMKRKSASAVSRNIIYPLAMLLLLFLTSITILLVLLNIVEILIGFKALPVSLDTTARQFTLGMNSLSKLGVFGALLEIFVILYLVVTSFVGFYTMPLFAKLRPRRRKTSLTHLIANNFLILILASALPLLSRILGITNFDLLGDFGEIEWLGNFKIVFMYNSIFIVAAVLCIITKFTDTVRKELVARLMEVFTEIVRHKMFCRM